MPLSPLLSPVDFAAVPGWERDDQSEAYAAFRRSAVHSEARPYRSGALGIDSHAFAEAYAEARSRADPVSAPASARAFFERHFVPHRVSAGTAEGGFVTGFYEPMARAARSPGTAFRYPLYRRPGDLVDLDDGNRPADLDPYFAFGRATCDGIVEFFDRRAIEKGALHGRELEIAWLADPVDLFFIHVQGAARLVMDDGGMLRVTYAAKSGHRFTGPGGILAGMGEIARAEVTMQSIRAWLRAHPDRVDEILWQNRSFIFFREAPVDDPTLGPVAAAKVPLTPGRSMAVDRLLHTFGTPFFIRAPSLEAFGGVPFGRLMIAQDTGSAIVGAARGDLFTGSGEAAGEIAGVIKHPADFFALVPRVLAGGAAA